jgi:competence protein ComEA
MFTRSFPALLLGACVALPFASQAGPIDINSADAKQIAKELKGVGLARAQAIVAYRDKNGPFKAVADLAKVKGVGKKMIQRNVSSIRLDGAKSGSAASPAD